MPALEEMFLAASYEAEINAKDKRIAKLEAGLKRIIELADVDADQRGAIAREALGS